VGQPLENTGQSFSLTFWLGLYSNPSLVIAIRAIATVSPSSKVGNLNVTWPLLGVISSMVSAAVAVCHDITTVACLRFASSPSVSQSLIEGWYLSRLLFRCSTLILSTFITDALALVGEEVTNTVGKKEDVGTNDGFVVGVDVGRSVGSKVGAQNEHALHFGLEHLKRLPSVAHLSSHLSTVGDSVIMVGTVLGINESVMVGPVVILGAAVVGECVGGSVGDVVGAQKGHALHFSLKHLKRLSSEAHSSSHVSSVGKDELVGRGVGDSVMI